MSRSSGLVVLALFFSASAGCASSRSDGQPPVFYPPPPVEPRLQWLACYSGASDIEDAGAFRAFVVGQEDERTIAKAHGVAWLGDSLYVVDSSQCNVSVFDFDSDRMRPLVADDTGFFKKPIGIAVSSDGWKYVTDTGHRKVLTFDPQDRWQKALGDPEKWKPTGVAVDGDTLYVTDVANHQVVLFDRGTGEEKARWGKQGGEEGSFWFPLSVTVGPGQDVYVSDSFNCRIQRFSKEGKFLKTIGGAGMSAGQFARPRGVSVDRQGRIFVVDAAFENVQIFDAEGKLLLFFGGPGDAPGCMNMPASVEVSYEAARRFEDRVAPGYAIDYVVFVTSQTGPNKVNVYGLLRKE